MAKDWDTITPQTGMNDKFRLEDYVGVIDKKRIASTKAQPKYHAFRFHGGVSSFETAWIPLWKDGAPMLASKGNNVGKVIEIPKLVLSYDPDTESYKDDPNNPDPVLAAVQRMNDVLDSKERIRIQRTYIGNCIHREIQAAMPRNLPNITQEEYDTGFKDIHSQSWTANFVWPMPGGMADKIKNLKQLNQIRSRKDGSMHEFSVTHPQFGCDVNIKYMPGESATAMYDIQKGNRTPLTEEELAMLKWDVDAVQRYIETVDVNKLADDIDRMTKGFFANRRGSAGGGPRRRQLLDDDMPEDLANDLPPPAAQQRGRGRAAPAAVAMESFGDDDIPFDDAAAPFDDGTGGFADDGGGDFDGGLDGGFDEPAPVQTRPAGRQQQRGPAQNRAPARGVAPAMDEGFGDLNGLDDANEFDDGGAVAGFDDGGEFGGDDTGFGDTDFGDDNVGFDDDLTVAAPVQQPRRQQQAPPQNRGPAPQQRQAAPQQRVQAPQNRGPAPVQTRPAAQQQRPAQQQQQRPPQQAPQNRGPAPQQQRPVQRPPQGRPPQQRR